jgi:hypothetical protein
MGHRQRAAVVDLRGSCGRCRRSRRLPRGGEAGGDTNLRLLGRATLS